MSQFNRKRFTPFIGQDKNADKSMMADWFLKTEPKKENSHEFSGKDGESQNSKREERISQTE